jgi:hypothetical protein
MSFELPDTPLIVAGGLGGPFCLFSVTPARNALTLGATQPGASISSLYRQVFERGFARGWTGGVYPAAAACPSFICLGPAFHMMKGYTGVPMAILLASCCESAIMFGGETANAQMAKNEKSPGAIKKIQPAYSPFGAGLGLHIARNALATAGLRLFCTPCEWVLEKATGRQDEFTKTLGSFGGNVVSACLTAPVHQLYAFVVTSPELSTMSSSDKRARMVEFLKEQYLITENGKTRLASGIARDMTMRSMYVATLYTMFSSIERTLVAYWPK